jgi:hypothetical protein
VADEAPGTFSPPQAPDAGGDNPIVQQIMQMLMGGGGAPGGFGGTNPMMMPPAMPDALGAGGGDPLGMLGMASMGGGSMPGMAHVRMQRQRDINALNQKMANAHRGIGRFGGTDYARHVQNIDDEMQEIQDKAVQQNIQNALAMDREALSWAQFNRSQDLDYWKMLSEMMTEAAKYKAAGTASGAPETQPEAPG